MNIEGSSISPLCKTPRSLDTRSRHVIQDRDGLDFQSWSKGEHKKGTILFIIGIILVIFGSI